MHYPPPTEPRLFFRCHYITTEKLRTSPRNISTPSIPMSSRAEAAHHPSQCHHVRFHSNYLLSKRSDENKIESVAVSIVAGLTTRPANYWRRVTWNYFTPCHVELLHPTDHDIGSAVYTHDGIDTCAPSIVL